MALTRDQHSLLLTPDLLHFKRLGIDDIPKTFGPVALYEPPGLGPYPASHLSFSFLPHFNYQTLLQSLFEEFRTGKAITFNAALKLRTFNSNCLALAYAVMICRLFGAFDKTNSDYWGSIDAGNLDDQGTLMLYIALMSKIQSEMNTNRDFQVEHYHKFSPTSFGYNFRNFFVIESDDDPNAVRLANLKTELEEFYDNRIDEISGALEQDKDFAEFFCAVIDQAIVPPDTFTEDSVSYYLENRGIPYFAYKRLLRVALATTGKKFCY